MKHSKIGCSSAHRWLACPGSIRRNWDAPKTSNEYALRGTSAHALLEICLRLEVAPARFLGLVLDAGLYPVDEDMVDGIQYVLDYVAEYMAANPGTVLLIERTVYPSTALDIDKDLLFGTPDVQLCNFPHELVTVDYKHGVGVKVAVQDNAQIKLYHLGRAAERGRYRRYRSVVVQPRVPKRKPIQEATLTHAKLTAWAKDTVRPTIHIGLAGDAPLKAGDHCFFCASKQGCPARHEEKQARAAAEFGKLAKPVS